MIPYERMDAQASVGIKEHIREISDIQKRKFREVYDERKREFVKQNIDKRKKEITKTLEKLIKKYEQTTKELKSKLKKHEYESHHDFNFRIPELDERSVETELEKEYDRKHINSLNSAVEQVEQKQLQAVEKVLFCDAKEQQQIIKELREMKIEL